MKYQLLLSALIFTLPAWATETAATAAAPQAAEKAAPAAKHSTKKTHKHTKAQKKAAAAALTCPTGCSAMTCGGVAICVKNKPAALCTKCSL